MQYQFSNTFYKQLQKTQNKTVIAAVKNAVINIDRAKNISEIKNIKALKGYSHYYRIRIGDYRIGLEIKNTNATFLFFGHRKDIYKKYL